MANRLKVKHDPIFLPATVSGSGLGDFPVGSIRSRAAVRALLANRAAELIQEEAAELGKLNPYEQAIAEDADPEIVLWLVKIARIAEERAEIYGITLQTPEEIRHNKKIAKIANEITGGEYGEIILSNPREAKRIRELAEEKLKAEATRGPQALKRS